MSEETGGKQKTPGKILAVLGLVFGLVALICAIISYTSVPSADETDAAAAVGGALGSGLTMMLAGFFGWIGIILGVIGLIIGFVKKAQSKMMHIMGTVIPVVAIVVMMMAAGKWAALSEAGPIQLDSSDWGEAFEEGMNEAMDEAMDDMNDGH